MKYYSWLLVQGLFLLVACGDPGSTTTYVVPPKTCTVVTNTTGSTISCPDGSSAFIPNNNVTMVQFCSNYSGTTYPTSFPEFGLCLNNLLYGVYWDGHNSWLAEIVPGYYLSTSTSAPCNFHVLPNCGVSP